jgi:hypothetical protein
MGESTILARTTWNDGRYVALGFLPGTFRGYEFVVPGSFVFPSGHTGGLAAVHQSVDADMGARSNT